MAKEKMSVTAKIIIGVISAIVLATTGIIIAKSLKKGDDNGSDNGNGSNGNGSNGNYIGGNNQNPTISMSDWQPFDWVGGQCWGDSKPNCKVYSGLHILGGKGIDMKDYFKKGDKVEIKTSLGSNIPNLDGKHKVINLYDDTKKVKDMIRVDVIKPSGSKASGMVRKI